MFGRQIVGFFLTGSSLCVQDGAVGGFNWLGMSVVRLWASVSF